jgi:hypothetical protein
MEYARYKVIGKRQYRGHEPGEIFEARFDSAIERAVYRGNIEILEIINPELPGGGYTLPKGWPRPVADITAQQEAPQGASSISKEGS